MSAPAVELVSVGKGYDRVRALEDVSLVLEPGRLLALLGPSGSGKSTLLRCVAGIERVDSGSIAIGGRRVADPRKQLAPEARDLGMVFQDFALWPHMTAAQNVASALHRRRPRGAEAARQATAMLDRMGLAGLRDRYPHELSGGEQQRVALARALVARPGLLLFDEPLSSLDANLREQLRIEIGTLVRETGASAVYITHDQDEAFALGDEVGVLSAGRLVQHAPPELIYSAPADPFVARFTGIAGSLTGTVVESNGNGQASLVRIAVRTTAPERFLELRARAMSSLAAGAAAQVLLRPSAVRICRADAEAARLRGTIRDVAFRGRGYDYVVEVGSGLKLAGLSHRRRHGRGDQVGLHLDPLGCFAYPADQAAPR
jgi:iron(III) transport system ATP-binding protein